jgi:hypothetical protein
MVVPDESKERASGDAKRKLHGLSPLLWINLDSSVERRARMESELVAWGIEGRRIAAVDGRQGDAVSKFLHGEKPARKHNPAELGCTLSHLRAIDTFLRDDRREFAVICEDDIDFGLANYWPFRFEDVIRALPSDWECLQLAISTAAEHVTSWLHPRESSEYCACAYAIRRPYAERLMQLAGHGGKYDLSKLALDHHYGHCIDHFLYERGVTYSIPLLTYHHALPSTIQVETVMAYVAIRSSNAICAWWKTEGMHMDATELLTLEGAAEDGRT